MISAIDLALVLLQAILDSGKKNKLADEVITEIRTAVESLLRVRGSDVTFSQLQGLRVKPQW